MTTELTGVLDISRARELHSLAVQLVAAGESATIDCARVERIDTSAAQILIALGRDLQAAGRTLELANVPDTVAAFSKTIGVGQALLPAVKP